MLYLGIDQHKRQLTVDLLGEDGSGVLKRQVSTEWDKVRTFFADLAEKARPEGGFLAILEVCGMNPWLLAMLKEYGCRETVVIQPTEFLLPKVRFVTLPTFGGLRFAARPSLTCQGGRDTRCELTRVLPAASIGA